MLQKVGVFTVHTSYTVSKAGFRRRMQNSNTEPSRGFSCWRHRWTEPEHTPLYAAIKRPGFLGFLASQTHWHDLVTSIALHDSFKHLLHGSHGRGGGGGGEAREEGGGAGGARRVRPPRPAHHYAEVRMYKLSTYFCMLSMCTSAGFLCFAHVTVPASLSPLA